MFASAVHVPFLQSGVPSILRFKSQGSGDAKGCLTRVQAFFQV